MNKYRNKKVKINNYVFDSIAESKRYKELALLERAKIIKRLQLQPRFLLQEGFRKNGETFRPIFYVADFMYEEKGQVIVEDVKGMETKDFKIKRKLFEYKYQDLTLKLIKQEFKNGR